MRAESNHTLPACASSRTVVATIQRVSFVMACMCIIIGIVFIVTLKQASSQTKIKGTATQLSSSQVLAYVNLLRQESGLAPLEVHPALEQAAAQKAAHMIAGDYWEHTDPHSGITPWQFIDDAGYRYVKAGENLARDFDDARYVTEAWMASPPHRANLLESAYKHTGIGIAYGVGNNQPTVLVVQLLATPLPLSETENKAEFMSTTAVAPQSKLTLILIFAGGLVFVLIGLVLFILSRRYNTNQAPDRQSNNAPPLHLWSS